MDERVWDRFLTEQDKQHLARCRPKTPYGFGRRAAVLSVDNYRAAIGDEPLPLLESIDLWPNSTGQAGWDALARIAELLEHARRAGLPIIHVTGLAEEDSGIPGWSARRGGRGAGTDRDAAAQDRHRRRYDIAPQAAPVPGEVVLRKTAPSAFFGTPLLAHLVGAGIDTLIVVGEAVSGCVRATVVDGCSNRLNMIVVEECVYDRHEATRAMNLFDMDQKYADVISLAETLAYIDSLDAESGHEQVHDHGRTHGQEHAHHTHSHHSHHSHDEDDRTPVRLPKVVLSAVPDGAQLREVCEHPIHGRVIEQAGDEVIEAAGAAMVEGFTSSRHVVVRVTADDLSPDDDPRLAAALTMSAGGVLLIGIGYEPAEPPASQPAPAAASLPTSAPAGAACPECGNTEVDLVDTTLDTAGRPMALLLGCPECETVWDAVP
jgi:nicotinamidase-related amidase/DNA-directed RNA polymerase subunit M/transcription elongation factor TFIIS